MLIQSLFVDRAQVSAGDYVELTMVKCQRSTRKVKNEASYDLVQRSRADC